MSETSQDRLYNLLPDLYLWRDREQGESLRMFLSVIESEFSMIEADMAAQHNNWFIQTCDRWAIPYIADLLGVRQSGQQAEHLPFSQRRLVANTLAYRRRKGTLVVLEQVTWDVTNWYTHAVEFHQLLATTQHLRHLRPDKSRVTDLRQRALVSAADGPFSTLAHTIDLRKAALPQIAQSATKAQGQMATTQPRSGKYNRNQISLFLWRLKSYPVKRSYANTVSDAGAHPGCFRFSRNGDIPLFNSPQPFTSITQLATAVNMPIRLTRAEFAADLAEFTKLHERDVLFYLSLDFMEELPMSREPSEKLRTEFQYYGRPLIPETKVTTEQPGKTWVIINGDTAYTIRKGKEKLYVYKWDDSNQMATPLNSAFYGPDRGLNILRKGKSIPPWRVVSLNLKHWPTLLNITNWDPQIEVAIDVELGRMVFLDSPANCTDVVTDYTYGFSSEIGGGPYARNLQLDNLEDVPFQIQVAIGGVDANSPDGKQLITDFRSDKLKPDPAIVGSLELALACWNAYCENPNHQKKGTISILDNGLYRLSAISLLTGSDLTIIANDGVQPIINGDGAEQTIQLLMWDENALAISDAEALFGSRLCLNGLRIESTVMIEPSANSVSEQFTLAIAHCTLMHAGWSLDSSLSGDSLWLTVQLDSTIVGPIQLPTAAELLICDSIIDSNGVGATKDTAIVGSHLAVARSTIFGRVEVEQLPCVSSVIFNDPVAAVTQSESAIEYSYFPPGSKIVLPDNLPPAGQPPVFTSRRYGQPGYAQLDSDSPPAIRAGAENGSEIGVFHHLAQPQRESNLVSMLDEYLPFSFAVGAFYVT